MQALLHLARGATEREESLILMTGTVTNMNPAAPHSSPFCHGFIHLFGCARS